MSSIVSCGHVVTRQSEWNVASPSSPLSREFSRCDHLFQYPCNEQPSHNQPHNTGEAKGRGGGGGGTGGHGDSVLHIANPGEVMGGEPHDMVIEGVAPVLHIANPNPILKVR